jgi:hypothetical protein
VAARPRSAAARVRARAAAAETSLAARWCTGSGSSTGCAPALLSLLRRGRIAAIRRRRRESETPRQT